MQNLKFHRKSILVLVMIVSFTFNSCYKKSSSTFNLTRYTYAPGETVEIVNLSKHTKHQLWEIITPNDEVDVEGKGPAPQLILSVLDEDGIYKVRAYDNQHEQAKKIYTEKAIFVSADRGIVKVYGNNMSDWCYDIYIDNQKFVGKTGSEFKLPIGKHVIKSSTTYYPGGPTYSIDTVLNVQLNTKSTLDFK